MTHRKCSGFFALATLSLRLACFAPEVSAADLAWTQDQTSAGMQASDADVPVAFRPGPRDPAVPQSARITRVYASRSYAGTARVATMLCWGSAQGPCVTLHGSQINSHAFDGRSARGPLWLVYRVIGWGTDHPPVFVRGTVTVWFTDARRR